MCAFFSKHHAGAILAQCRPSSWQLHCKSIQYTMHHSFSSGWRDKQTMVCEMPKRDTSATTNMISRSWYYSNDALNVWYRIFILKTWSLETTVEPSYNQNSDTNHKYDPVFEKSESKSIVSRTEVSYKTPRERNQLGISLTSLILKGSIINNI